MISSNIDPDVITQEPVGTGTNCIPSLPKNRVKSR